MSDMTPGLAAAKYGTRNAGWCVIHTASGQSISPRLRLARHAEAMAAELAGVLDWTRELDTIRQDRALACAARINRMWHDRVAACCDPDSGEHYSPDTYSLAGTCTGTAGAARDSVKAGKAQAYLVTVTGLAGVPATALDWLGLSQPAGQPPNQVTLMAVGHADLRRHLASLRHPELDVHFTLAGADGEPASPPVHTVRCTDNWLRLDVDHGTRAFFIYEKPSGKTRYHVMEAGAGARGTARRRAEVATIAAALELCQSLEPSTPEEILASIKTYTDADRRYVEDLARYGTPGTRLWVTPAYTEHGYHGRGHAATALGLEVSGVEAMFGSELHCWLVSYRRDDGVVDAHGPQVVMTIDEATRGYWVVDAAGQNLITGGHYDRDRMTELAIDTGGVVVHGLIPDGHPALGRCDGHIPSTIVETPGPRGWDHWLRFEYEVCCCGAMRLLSAGRTPIGEWAEDSYAAAAARLAAVAPTG
jgi:hypothetical protein